MDFSPCAGSVGSCGSSGAARRCARRPQAPTPRWRSCWRNRWATTRASVAITSTNGDGGHSGRFQEITAALLLRCTNLKEGRPARCGSSPGARRGARPHCGGGVPTSSGGREGRHQPRLFAGGTFIGGPRLRTEYGPLPRGRPGPRRSPPSTHVPCLGLHGAMPGRAVVTFRAVGTDLLPGSQTSRPARTWRRMGAGPRPPQRFYDEHVEGRRRARTGRTPRSRRRPPGENPNRKTDVAFPGGRAGHRLLEDGSPAPHLLTAWQVRRRRAAWSARTPVGGHRGGGGRKSSAGSTGTFLPFGDGKAPHPCNKGRLAGAQPHPAGVVSTVQGPRPAGRVETAGAHCRGGGRVR